MAPPNSSWLNRMCTDAQMLIYKRFFGCLTTLTSHCGSIVSAALLGSLDLGNTLLDFLRSENFVFTLLDFVGNYHTPRSFILLVYLLFIC